MRVIARPKVVQEDNALTHDRDNQGYNQGYCATSVHLRYFCYLTAAQVVCIAAFDDQLAFTMSGGAASVGPVKASAGMVLGAATSGGGSDGVAIGPTVAAVPSLFRESRTNENQYTSITWMPFFALSLLFLKIG
jgi:hypothetical protein